MEPLKMFKGGLCTKIRMSSDWRWGRLGTELTAIPSKGRIMGNRAVQDLPGHLIYFPTPGQD